MQRHHFLRALAGAALAALLAAHAQAQTTKLRMAHSGAETETQHLAALEFARQVKARTNGQIEVQVYGSSALGNDNTVIGAVRGGTIDLATSGTPYYTGMVGRMNVLDLPYLFTSTEHAYKVLDGPIGRSLLDELEGHGMKGLAYWEVGFRSLTNSRRAVRTPDDVKGLKIRTTPNPAHIKAFQILGATPTPMPLAEVFTALENKAVDGQENPVNIVRNNKLYEVQKYMSLTRHAYTAMPVVMNKAKFAALKPEQQQALIDAARAAATFQRDLIRKSEAGDIAFLRSQGMQVEENVDPEPFHKLVAEPTQQMFADKYGRQLIDAVLQAR
ncbi:TRAP transporter substrate-binding protein [Paracidovorax wautersii]|uniref:Tripartite ATP-independent transporter solute receptor, DctP family n=1 Tax=Paracidovorax wautersii TaxID=1177982 RepID=A0A1I2FCJ1_9BURK|nr:TRAP transporter substrate-binding protein [Paracidovorax wautersii]SFF02743.1 tripartite ATP-independent transporter solute receptor, DctP family [Paracidovorax wautersii]